MTIDDRKQIFEQIKILMKKYEPPFIARKESDTRFELWSLKEIIIDGRKRKEIYFAGLNIQSNYVGFYYMPVYSDTTLKDVFEPELLSLLKGKSCFHIKKLDKKLLTQIKKSLEIGFQLYKKHHWV
jgi:hypothetical protein